MAKRGGEKARAKVHRMDDYIKITGVPPDVLDLLKRTAARRRITVNDLLLEIFREELARRIGKESPREKGGT